MKLRDENPGVIIQVFGAANPPNALAVELIAAQTLEATRSGSTLADRPELDLLLRLAGTRQIGEAFRRSGYKSNAKRLFIVSAAEGSAAKMRRLGASISKDSRFKELPRKELGKDDMDAVERAALLAAEALGRALELGDAEYLVRPYDRHRSVLAEHLDLEDLVRRVQIDLAVNDLCDRVDELLP